MQDYVQTLFGALTGANSAGTALPLPTLTSDRKTFLIDSTLDVPVVLMIGTTKLVYLRAGASLLVDLLGVSGSVIPKVYCIGTPTIGDLLFNLQM